MTCHQKESSTKSAHASQASDKRSHASKRASTPPTPTQTTTRSPHGKRNPLLPTHPPPANHPTHRKDLEAFHAAATSHLAALYATLAEPARAKFLAQAHVHPTPAFPRAAEHMVELLLRKRHHPAVADWLERGAALGAALERPPASEDDARSVDWDALWRWAGPASSGVASAVFPEFVSEEEGAPVRKAKDVVRDETGPGMPIEDLLRFMASGDGS